jgi:dCTP deaminase
MMEKKFITENEKKTMSATDEKAMKSVLSDKAILRMMGEGRVVIEPFVRENLSTTSYDVTLGEYFYREQEPEPSTLIYNMYSERMVNKVWGSPQRAQTLAEWSAESGLILENIDASDRIIFVRPGETILAHTREFIGGGQGVTTMMKSRSSLGRNFIAVCKCAGWV